MNNQIYRPVSKCEICWARYMQWADLENYKDTDTGFSYVLCQPCIECHYKPKK